MRDSDEVRAGKRMQRTALVVVMCLAGMIGVAVVALLASVK